MALTPLLTFASGYAAARGDVIAPAAADQLHIYRLKAQNGTAGAIDVGLMKRLSSQIVSFYTITAANTPDATINTTLQAGTATQILSAVNNTGFLVQCSRKFNLIGLFISTASTGGTFTLEYWNGSSYATLTAFAVPTAYAAGVQFIVFNAPVDWVPGTSVGVGGSSSLYSIKVVATTAPANAVSASSLWVAEMLDFHTALASKGILEMEFPIKPLVLSGDEAIIPYFGTADAKNTIMGTYAVQD
jgi:hypothetical protein